MPTFEITIYVGYKSTSYTNLSLLISLAAMEELDTGVEGGLQRGPPWSMLQSSAVEKDSTFFQHTCKMASC
jgi:hypothetical protein